MEVVAEFLGVDIDKGHGNISETIGLIGFPMLGFVQILLNMQLICGILHNTNSPKGSSKAVGYFF